MRFSSLAVLAALAGAAGSDMADWRHFAAGGAAAALSHGYTTPIDVVKTRMQTNPELGKRVTVAARRIVREEGPGYLLSGLAPTLAGYGVEGALKFGCYELLKPAFAELTRSKVFNYLCASVVAGGVASLVLCPAEDVRIRQVADPNYADGAVDAFCKLVAEKGPLASFEGMPAMLSKQVPYTMGKQVSFDVACECVRSLLSTFVADEALRLRMLQFVPVVAALPAAVLACVLSHPGDMLLTVYYQGGGRTVAESYRNIVAEGGHAALFRGLRARLIHVISIIWVQLIMYDKLKQALGLPATGH